MRIVVAQTRPRLIYEGEGAPLSVGVLRWSDIPKPDPYTAARLDFPARCALSVIVKGTFSYAECESAAEAASPASEPLGMSLDCLWDEEDILDKDQIDLENDQNIWYPSDFIPLKRHADILLAGHAHSARPAIEIPASIQIGEWSREFVAVAKKPAMKIPLRAEHIRLPPGMAPGERVGADPTPPIAEPHSIDFDFSLYNRAAPSSRVPLIAPNAVLTLSGLSARADRQSFQLPGLVPRLFADGTQWDKTPIELACDTLWLDTDQELIVLLWRSVIFFPDEDDYIQRLYVSLESMDRPRDFPAIRAELPRGVFNHAVLASDLEEGKGEAPAESGEVLLAKYETWDQCPEPTISLEKYADISAELAEQRGERKDCLKKHGLDEDSWTLEERAWAEKMGNAAMEGDAALAMRYGELFVAAQDRLSGPEEGRETIDEYAALKAEVEASDNPMELFKARSITFAQWMRQERRWTRDAMKDRNLAADIERRTQAYRIRIERRRLEGAEPQDSEDKG